MSVRGSLSGSPERRRRARTAVTAVVAMVAALLVPVLGQVAPASATVTQTEIATAEYPIGIDEDAAGNIYIGDAVDQVAANDGLTVVPAKTGTLFGQSVTAGVEHRLVAASAVSGTVQGVAVDSHGNVFFTTSSGNLYVLPLANGTLFGQSVTANTLKLLENNAGFAGGIAFDSAGNLFAADEATSKVIALPTTGVTSLYGVSTTQYVVANLITTGGYWWWDVAVDSNNNLLLTSGWSNAGVYMIPKTTGTFYGQTFSSAGTAGFAALSKYTSDVANGAQKPAGIDVSPSGTVYVAYWGNIVSALAPTAQILFGTSVPALTATRLTATGSGYTNQGVMFSASNDLITGGSSATWRIRTSGTASPSTGSTSGGTTVTFGGLSGCVNVIEAYLADGTKVTPANSCSSTGGTSVNLTMPAHAAGAQTLYVEWQSSTATYLYPATFTYGTPPSISSISPKSGSTSGGAVVTISGSFTNGVTGVTIGGTSASITSSNTSSVTVVAPAGTAGAASVAVTNAYGTSTLSNSFTYVTGPVITSLSPASGAPAGGTVVRITGSGLSDVTGVTFGSSAGTSLTIDSSTSLVVTTPSGTSGAAVNVAATNGITTSTLTSAFSYNGPVISSVSPATGSTAGSTAVHINGTNLSGCTGATFGGAAATSVSYDSTNTRLNATTPAGTAGPVSVAVTCASSTGFTLANAFTYGAPPTVTSVSPSTIWASGGEAVTITGTNFANASAVTFDGTATSSFTVINSTTIKATSPAGSGSSKNVVVTTPYGTGTGTGVVSFATAPQVSEVAPATRSTAGGQLVSISGTGFTGTPTVTFGGTAGTSVQVISPTLIRVTTPAMSAGNAAIVVTTSGGASTQTVNLLFEAPPTITSVSPSSGDVAGGTSVTITGTNFTGTDHVTFGGAPATSVTVVNATTVTAVTPSGSAGAVAVTLETGAGLVSDTSGFTYTGGSSGGGGGGGSSESTPASTPTPTPTSTASTSTVPTTAPTADPANAGLKPGGVNVLIGGQDTPVATQENKAGGKVTVTGNGWATSVSSRSGSKAVPLTQGGALNLQTGQQATISVNGFAPGSNLGVALLSSPISLGTIPVNASGAATDSLKIPSTAPAGSHTLQVNGYSATGELRSVAFGVMVTKSTSTGKVTVKRATVTFAPNSSTLTSSDKKALSNLLSKVPKGAKISAVSVGYAYGSNSDGSAETLAKARAKSVLKYLSESRKLASSKATGKVLPATGRPGQATLTLAYS
jgi:outer membrane protein OmpA-like peptidoglycan-associated protein